MTTMRIIKVWLADGLVTVKAAPTPTPGLFVNEDPRCSGQWNVTHLASGGALAKLDDPEMALHIAIKLGPVCDWTLPGTAIRQSAAIRQRAFRVLAEEGVLEQSKGPAVPDEQFAQMEPLS